MPEEYVTSYVFENSETKELNYKPKILLHLETEGEADSYDIASLLYCSINLSSKLLRVLWEKGFLIREKKKTYKKRGRPAYVYSLAEKGGKVCNLLHKKGY